MRLRLIVTSRLADDRLWAEALNLGAYDVLAKPFERMELVRSVSSAWLHWLPQIWGLDRARIGDDAGRKLTTAPDGRSSRKAFPEAVDPAVLRADDDAAGGDGGEAESGAPASKSQSFLPPARSST